jgi:transcriptional regulator with XRE-family HTH domain
MPFAEKAKVLYSKGKLTQKEIAKLSGVSESMVCRYLKGETVPREDVAEKILEVLAAAIPKEEPVSPPSPAPAPKKEDTPDMKIALDHLTRVYDSHIAELKRALQIERREKWIFVCLLGLVIALVFLTLFVDLTNGSVGWWRY